MRWLNLSLERQLNDLDLYLDTLPESERSRLEDWLKIGAFGDLIPADAPEPERLLFQMDMEILSELRAMARLRSALS